MFAEVQSQVFLHGVFFGCGERGIYAGGRVFSGLNCGVKRQIPCCAVGCGLWDCEKTGSGKSCLEKKKRIDNREAARYGIIRTIKGSGEVSMKRCF